MIKQIASAVAIAAATFSTSAGAIPVGLQANVSAATVASWGFTPCASTPANGSGLLASTVATACQGDYVAMAVRDTRTTTYQIFGAGEYDVVTKITYADYGSDDAGGSRLNNWSNGLNFYRTAGFGSWGFTTIDRTSLNSADILLVDGINNFGFGASEDTVAAAGLSFHLDGNAAFMQGWAFNTTGYNYTSVYESWQVREFLVASAPRDAELPEPGMPAVVAAALLAAGLVHKRRAK